MPGLIWFLFINILYSDIQKKYTQYSLIIRKSGFLIKLNHTGIEQCKNSYCEWKAAKKTFFSRQTINALSLELSGHSKILEVKYVLLSMGTKKKFTKFFFLSDPAFTIPPLLVVQPLK